MIAISVRSVARVFFGRTGSTDHRFRRLFAVAQGSATSLSGRVVGMIVSFVSVPLTVGYLGQERYGAWVTLGAILAWMRLSDFGLGLGLTNAITTAAGQDRPNLVRMHLSNGVLLLSGVAVVAGLIAFIVWPMIDWPRLFGVAGGPARAEIGPAVALALAIMLVQFPFSLAGKVYLAYQEGRIGNYWGMGSNALSLAALILVTQTQGGLIWLVLAISGSFLLGELCSSLWLYGSHRPELRPGLRHIGLGAIRSLSLAGGQFFLIQIMALVTFQTDTIVVGHYLGAARVPEYSLTYSLFNYTSLPQSVLFTYLWAAYNEAISRGDINWVSRVFHLNLIAGLGLTVALSLALVFIAQPFIAWWSGAAIRPGWALIEWMAAWAVINAFTNPIACLLAAASHLRAQIVYSAAATASNIALSIVLVQRWGVHGVIAATVLAYGVFVCVPTYLDARGLLLKLRRAAPVTA